MEDVAGSPPIWPWLLTPEQRKGLMVAVISGGRPKVKERPTARLLADLHDLDLGEIVWVVSEADAASYESDAHRICTYTREWAYEYAKAHWMLPTPPPADGFLGAFPGREAACLEAERRGCWGVLQLDDNILSLRVSSSPGSAARVVKNHGGLALFADMLGALTLSTNGRMVGAQLDAVATEVTRNARKGFPYSLFIEQVGAGREHWYGPFEDDITHAFQYGTRSDGATAVVTPWMRYFKETQSKTGMRSKYNHERSVQLQRIFPESAKVMVKTQKANGRGGPRIFHKMNGSAIRNPMRITDLELFTAYKHRMDDLLAEWHVLRRAAVKEKIAARTAKVGASS